jgi:diaminopimelate decarboxylase
MSLKKMLFTKKDLEKIVTKFPTPFHIYDEKAIRENARDLLRAFEWNEGFKEYFAVKATPNPFLLKILKSEGFGTDCSSLPELLLSEKAGMWARTSCFLPTIPPRSSSKKPAN